MPVITGIIGPVVEGGAVAGRARDLAGQVVVVTGAARGIGALAAMRLAARNAGVGGMPLGCTASCGVVPGDSRE